MHVVGNVVAHGIMIQNGTLAVMESDWKGKDTIVRAADRHKYEIIITLKLIETKINVDVLSVIRL